MKNKINIVLAGVGGQGVITAANLLGKAAVRADVNVFASEVHGMAQRGGNVNCTVRLGNVSGPLVPLGCADVILGLEPVETLRNIQYANSKTIIITDVNPVIPFTVAVGGEKYPPVETIFSELNDRGILYLIDAVKIAQAAGAVITKNIVVLGALSATNVLPFKPEVLLSTILENVPVKYKEVNEKAFKGGVDAVTKQRK